MKLLFSIFRTSNSISAQRNVFNRLYISTPSSHLYRPNNGDTLYRRISPLGDPNASITPVLDQWIEEGKPVVKEELQNIIKVLRGYRRYKHALESVEKAEAIMQKMRDMGFASTPLCYNFMMNMYYQTGNWEKVDEMMNEMEGKGIVFDQFTLMIWLSAYAAAGDSDGIDKIATMMESDKRITVDWNTYSIIAEKYLNVGQVEKALAMLTKLEGDLATIKRNHMIYY
ncbi:hypothetical protein K7X08_016619 [Anisodus acutangulus]|uniref:Pentatricopeptide repeat-containing protein n=1 Tax=Anisodus acutangulus TaxID=402998 RepID=A0A9Q1LHY1_9SOLA|nr:hypothetical protein K7X08_016619 [Anisodus acutangulus]